MYCIAGNFQRKNFGGFKDFALSSKIEPQNLVLISLSLVKELVPQNLYAKNGKW